MRKPFVAGNWKMFKTVAEARHLVSELVPGLQAVVNVEKTALQAGLVNLSLQFITRDGSMSKQGGPGPGCEPGHHIDAYV